MRRLLALLALVLVLAPGCKKPAAKTTPPPAGTTTPPAGGQEQTTAHAPTGVVINPGLGGGGSGGAAQAVRKAATRAVNQNELNNIRTFIEAASVASGQMPPAQETVQSLQREAPATYKQIAEGAIVITGTRQREGIWAYTTDPQSTTGEHLIVTKDGVGRMMPDQLRQMLTQQR